MERFAGFLLKHKKVVVTITAVLAVLAIVATVLVVVLDKINSDMLEYLPEDMEISKGKNFLSEHFNIEGDAMLVVQAGEDFGKGTPIKAAVDEIKSMKIEKTVNGVKTEVNAVSQFVWVGAATAYDSISGIESIVDATELIAYLRQIAPESEWGSDGKPVYNYIFLGMLNASASSPEAFRSLTAMREAFSSRGLKVASEGMTHTADVVMNDTLAEIPLYLVFGLLAVLVILILATDSFIDPLILLVTLGVSILVAMGTNLIFPSVSIISFAVSSILQLAVTMDYAIVFMHIYKQKRAVSLTSEDAVKKALPNAWGSILASGLTTVGGFAALFFMRFELGADLGMVLIKAVALSMVSVIVLQPVLTVICGKATEKTRHKALKLSFEKTSNFVMKIGKPLVFITLLLLLPAYILQGSVKYSYFKMYAEPESPLSYQTLASELRNQLIIAVPYKVQGDAEREGKTPIDFIEELKTDAKIKNIVSIFSVLKPDQINDNIIKMIRMDELGNSFFADVEKDGKKTLYTLYTVILNGDVEDEASLVTFGHIKDSAERYFGENYYTIGMLTGVRDMASVTPTDFTLVSLVSAAIIFLVLLLLLRNLKQSILLILTIEIAIFLNLAISVLTGTSLNFMVYILISSVQLGCTVDYAILLATRYRDAYIVTGGDRYESARLAFKNSVSAILISASIIISVCLCVLLITKNIIIKQMMELIARGGAISLLLVLTSLPTFLSCTKPTLTKKEKVVFWKNFAAAPPPSDYRADLKENNQEKSEITADAEGKSEA